MKKEACTHAQVSVGIFWSVVIFDDDDDGDDDDDDDAMMITKAVLQILSYVRTA